MSDVPSAGWREVYRWCEVAQPEQIEAASVQLGEQDGRPA